MNKGTRVSFSWTEKVADGEHVHRGTGEVISEADDKARVLVAVDPLPGKAFHLVILCTLTWLTPIT